MSSKDTFDFFWKDKWIFTHLWETQESKRTTGERERDRATASSSASAEVCCAPWAGLSDSSTCVHPASLHSSATASSTASALQLQCQQRMAAAKTEMILPSLQISEPLSFPHSPMDNYPKLEEVMMLSSAGTPFLTASAPEGAGFGSGDPGDHYDHLAGGKRLRLASCFLCCMYNWDTY